MNILRDLGTLARLEGPQSGCFSKHDLQTALAEPHPSALARRLNALEEHGALQRFVRGFYVTPRFDPTVLSQRIAPESYLSLETVLGERGLVGVRPERRIVAVKTGKTRRYEGAGVLIEHLGVQPELVFGWMLDRVVRRATPEKAFLDALYFRQHGRPLPFDPYSDVQTDRLDRRRVDDYLGKYHNPKFVAFARSVLAA